MSSIQDYYATVSDGSENPKLRSFVNKLAAACDTLDKAEPQDLINLRTGQVKIGAGNQYYTTWEFVVGMLRDTAMMNWYPMAQKVLDVHNYPLATLIDSIKKENAPFMPYLKYNQFTEMNELYDEFLALAEEASRVHLRMIIELFVRYFNRYTSYALYYFDYKVGGDKYSFIPLPEDAPEADLTRRVSIKDGPRMKMSWPKLGIVAYARLALKENPQLVTDFIKALPCKQLHVHVFVSGCSTYAWLPLVTLADASVKERQCDAPVGRLRLSMLSGMKLIVQYGPVTENIETPVLGEIEERFHYLLPQLGQALWKDTYEEKGGIELVLEMSDEVLTVPVDQSATVTSALADAMAG